MILKDVYWLAGLLEGEGCFSTSRFCPIIALSMTDEDVVSRATKLLGASYGRHICKKPRKDCFQVHLYGDKAIAWMMTLYPLMGKRRQERIREIISGWKLRKKNFGNTKAGRLAA